MQILGVSAFYHDSAAVLLENGKIAAAAQEERFTRIKHDPAFPVHAIKACLTSSGQTMENIDRIIFYEKPFLKFERIIETYLAFAPRGFSSFSKAMPSWIKEKLFQKSLIKNILKENFGDHINWDAKIGFSQHHLSHASSAFFASPFKEAAVMVFDGVGEWATSSLWSGDGNDLVLESQIRFPHSLGLLYSAFTTYTGFKVNSGEYKVMGLAPYGTPKYKDMILENLIDIKEDGSFFLDMKYFNYCYGLTMTNARFHELFGGPPRKPETELRQKDMDLAASVQKVCEMVVFNSAQHLQKITGKKNLCLAGGVALNCVANGELQRRGIFENIWIQPASGDSGGALGAALSYYFIGLKTDRKPGLNDMMEGAYLGPKFETDETKTQLTELEAVFEQLDEAELLEKVAQDLADGKAVGWMSGRMEFGPRALGARSILADARNPEMQKNLNLKTKFRESFRPFAPCVLEEKAQDWFEIDCASPYMLMVANIAQDKRLAEATENENLFGLAKLNQPRSEIPAVTHVDYSARVQTVSRTTNQKLHRLISKFEEKTGCPVLVNTSFNVRGEPIVHSPKDAFRCFMGTNLDTLVIDDFYLSKEAQNKNLKHAYFEEFDLD